MKKNCMLIIFGPTGVGKTDMAFSIARYLPVEIVNIDLGQLYTPLSIGTAKPDWQASPVTHHLFDVIDEPKHFSVAAYREQLLAVLNDIWSRNKLPLLVGGSGFYLKSIFFPPLAKGTKGIEHDNKQNSWDMLYRIDPQRALTIDRNDTYRIERALNIWRTTGELPSTYAPVFDPPADFFLLFLTRDREELYKRINKRVHVMIEQGWLDEVAHLRGTDWEHFLQEKKLIGYNELLTYLAGSQTKESLDKAIEIIQRRTRHYAKRQVTFWRTLKWQIDRALAQQEKNSRTVQGVAESINLTFSEVDLYIKQLVKQLQMNNYI